MSTPTHNRLRIENLRIADYVPRVIPVYVLRVTVTTRPTERA